ncbi:MAG: hypothetical protein ACRD02_02205, partial [Acidimicrobiia bacterium]
MTTNISFLAIAPEVVLTAGILAVLLAEVTFSPPRPRLGRWLGAISGLTLAGAFAGAVWQGLRLGAEGGLYYGEMVALDGLAVVGRLVLVLVAALGLGTAWPLVEALGRRGAEFVALLLVSLTGMTLMAASA